MEIEKGMNGAEKTKRRPKVINKELFAKAFLE